MCHPCLAQGATAELWGGAGAEADPESIGVTPDQRPKTTVAGGCVSFDEAHVDPGELAGDGSAHPKLSGGARP